MSDEFELINSKIPDMGTMLAKRLASKPVGSSNPPKQFDPYEVLLKKKESDSLPVDTSTIPRWNETDIKRLEDYCNKMGIYGFSCGKMSPLAALNMLKQQFGEDFTDVPMEQRVPPGYQKIESVTSKKQILHG